MKNKGMYRLLSGVLCTSVLLSSQAYAAASADYSDFPQNWSKDAMEFAVKNNFITGVSEDKIAPKAALTRAQLAAILSRAMKTGAGDVSVLDNFTDADKNAWYAGSMAKAVELNILYGDGDSIYPDRPVTRQELFAILVRAFAVTGGDESTLASYNDAGSISSWAKAAISAMIAQGYASGYEDKTLRPTQQVTREEFAQLLYRMQEFYGSSAASDDKNKEEAKADEATKTNTKKTSGGGGSSSGGGSHSGGGSNSGSTATAEAIVDAEKAVVESTDMGTWLPLAFKDGYSIEKVTSVTVDGTDVTAKLSKVTTDGTIAKLPLVRTPKQVVIKSGDKTQTINLNGSGAASVYAGTQYLPKYVWAHGAVAAWDYYLTNYDKDGNVRINPTRTTFNLTEEANAHPYYSPDAEVKDGETFGEVVGNVTIMFNFNTDEEKAWFNGINKLELVEYNENKNTINSNLTYTSAGDVAHYNNKVGELTIPIGQSNFRNNGRYYVRVKSNGGDKASVLVPIHVVNEKAPTLLLRETAVSGRNLHFDVKDMTYAITTPIESVTLTDPKGDTTYNTHTGYLNAVNDAKVAGAEWLGYAEYIAAGDVKTTPNRPSAVKEVLEDGLLGDIQHSNTYGRLEAPKATVGETKENKDVEITFENADAYMGKITKLYLNDNWQELSTDAYTIEGNKITIKAGALKIGENKITVDATGYLSNVVTIDYAKETEKELSLSVATPISEGQDVVITVTNSEGDFLKNLSGVVLKNSDGTEKTVYHQGYEGSNAVYYVVSEDGKTITLKNVEPGIYTVSVSANYYEALTTEGFTVERTTPLKTAPSVAKHEKKDKDGLLESTDYYRLTFSGLEGKDLDTYLGAIKKVTVGTKAYTEATSIYFQNDNYRTKIADSTYGGYKDALDLAVNGIDATGEGTVITVEAKGYETMTYTLKGDGGGTTDPDEGKLTAPTVEKAELTTKSGFFEDCDYYRLRFGTISGTELTAYLNKVTGVTVNGVAYTKESTYMKESTFRVKAENDAYGTSAYDILDLAVNGVDTTKDTVIVITAEGYADVKFTINKTNGGGTTDPDEGKLTAPTVEKAELTTKSGFFEDCDYYRLRFGTISGTELTAYLNKVTGVTVNGVAYTKESTYMKESTFRVKAENDAYGTSAYDILDLAVNGVDTTKDTVIVITAEGYADLTYTIKKAGGSSDGKDDNTEEAKYKVSSCELVDGRYRLMFNGFSESELKSFLGNITEVTVAENKYTDKGWYSWGKHNYSKVDSKGYGVDSLELTADGFNTNDDTEIVIKGTLNGEEVTITFTYTAE